MIPNIAKPTSATDEIATSNARRRKNESGIIGSAWRLSQAMNATSSTAAATRKPIVCGDAQLCEFVRISAHTSENRPAGHEHRADDVEAARLRITRLVHGPERRGGGDDADRDIDPEHGRPVDVLDQEAAEQRADGEPEARDAGPDADRGRHLMARERGHDDRERERVHERGADALHGARRDQAAYRSSRARRRRMRA